MANDQGERQERSSSELHASETVAAQLNSAAIHLLRGLSATDRTSGLTDARLSALSVVVFGGPSTLGHLAVAEGVTAATMSRVVDGLVTLGLARRDPHPDSARKILVVATEEGRRVMQRARQRRIAVITQALAELSAADRSRIAKAASALVVLADQVPRAAAQLPER